MANRATAFGTLMRGDRRQAAAYFRRLLDAHGGNLSALARDLGVQYKTALRWRKTFESRGIPVRAQKFCESCKNFRPLVEMKSCKDAFGGEYFVCAEGFGCAS